MLIRKYGLRQVAMVVPAEQPEDPAAAQLLRDFLKAHGHEHEHVAKFARFQAANHSLHFLQQLWIAKAHLQTDEKPLHLPENETFKKVRLLRGLLWVVGFVCDDTAGGEAAAPATT